MRLTAIIGTADCVSGSWLDTPPCSPKVVGPARSRPCRPLAARVQPARCTARPTTPRHPRHSVRSLLFFRSRWELEKDFGELLALAPQRSKRAMAWRDPARLEQQINRIAREVGSRPGCTAWSGFWMPGGTPPPSIVAGHCKRGGGAARGSWRPSTRHQPTVPWFAGLEGEV